MIRDIASHTCNPVFRRGKPEDRDYLLHCEYDKVILIKSRRGGAIPIFGELGAEGDFSAQVEYLFSIDDRAYYYVVGMKVPEFGGFYMEPLTVFQNFEPLHQASAGIAGNQPYRQVQSRRFCGGCGAKTKPSLKERTLVCPSCEQTEYPKISPTIIVTITNRDKLLMSRYARGTYRNYTPVVGFVEIGEAPEGCVRRGAMKKMDLRVKNIRYYKSQPWVFFDTEIVGFTVGLDGDGTICLEEEKLCEAGWFTRDETVECGSYTSVRHEMVKAFKDGKTQQIVAYKRRSDYEP